MKAKQCYLISNSVVAIWPEYSKYGELHTRILEVNRSFVIDRNPYQIIDDHLRYFGSGIKGVIEGSNTILDAKINPIALNGPELIILVPTKSPTLKDCIWFNLPHIKDHKPHGEKRILVHLSNGDSIIVDNSFEQFKTRKNKGYILRTILEERQSSKALYVLDPGKRYHYQRKKGNLNFEMIIRRKKEEK